MVRITDLGNINSDTGEPATYIAYGEEDCRDSTDRSVYQLVLAIGDVVTMGKVVGSVYAPVCQCDDLDCLC
jgi:hypothetical protein